MKKKGVFLFLALVATLAFAGGSFAYAHLQTSSTLSASITASGAGVDGAYADILASDPLSGYATAATPTWNPAANIAGSISNGDLYYMDIGSYTGDLLVTLYLNNPAALSHDYSYLNMAICVYGTDSSGTAWNTSPISQFVDSSGYTTYLNITNGYVSFILHYNDTTQTGTGTNTHAYFAITVNGGAYYCINPSASNGNLSPQFYLDVRPA